MNRRGQVLVHVLITTVIVSVIAAGLAQLLIQRYTASARATDGTVKKAAAAAAMNQAIQQWNSSPSASNICTRPTTNYSLTSGAANSCNCVWTDNTGITVNGAPYKVRVEVSCSGGGCVVPCPSKTQLKACAADANSNFPGAGCP